MAPEIHMTAAETEVRQALSAINQAWLTGHPAAMRDRLHPELVTVFPGFQGQLIGRDPLMATFVDFCANARVLEYAESDEQVQVVEDCAVASYRFKMQYQRANYRARCSGRDLWMFRRGPSGWVAVWRTMLDLAETREDLPLETPRREP
jgi:hypothetical protein